VPGPAADIEQRLLVEEVKFGCTQGMLLCLDREHRIAYVLGAVLELSSDEAADVCGISPAAFRKRLQRARERIQQFMQGHCGLLDPDNSCRCRRRIGAAIERERVDPDNLLFAQRVSALKLEMERFTRRRCDLPQPPRAAHAARAGRRRDASRRVILGTAAITRRSRARPSRRRRPRRARFAAPRP